MGAGMDQASNGLPAKRVSRVGLYAPFALLGLVVFFWSAAWFVVQARVSDNLAAWREREASLGRRWACGEESFKGFPFRIEFDCRNPTFDWQTPTGIISTKAQRVRLFAQVYRPNHIIAEAEGPLASIRPDGLTTELDWEALQISAVEEGGRAERISFVAGKPTWRLVQGGETAGAGAANGLELHLRPTPQRHSLDGSYDLAVKLDQADIPAIRAIGGPADPVDLDINAIISRAAALLGRTPQDSLEAWRLLGGTLTLWPLNASIGPRRLIARGDLTIDTGRRPSGRIDISAAGLDEFVTRIGGGNRQIAAFVMGGLELLGGRQNQADPSGLKAIPPLRFESGRMFFGPLPIGPAPVLY